MGKGEMTREFIIREAAVLFNQKGYFGSSISDVARVTGMQKGGIYNHFENKDQLAVEAFEHATEVLKKSFLQAMEGKTTAFEKLTAVISVYQNAYDHPPLQGGCPLLNTAIESDDAHPALKEKAQQAMGRFLELLRTLLKQGTEQGEFVEDMNVQELAIYITSVIEGGVMLSKLYDDNMYIRLNINRLLKELERYRKV
ncbi:TetR/AcrR family transcriptional regulator [Aneurinibacillus tyrosinisolvens]|uniref:TetR/AcrR family transcriptional regulator n=1 Tax=Aneurinibacillus tyrosinisolvens TaxID=1443435 RepID=UPI00063EF89D|nr:TetR/AcrR family transcriptional regulator [Aneurinibacillus tyrosinisolvens]